MLAGRLPPPAVPSSWPLLAVAAAGREGRPPPLLESGLTTAAGDRPHEMHLATRPIRALLGHVDAGECACRPRGPERGHVDVLSGHGDAKRGLS